MTGDRNQRTEDRSANAFGGGASSADRRFYVWWQTKMQSALDAPSPKTPTQLSSDF
jgi:hypothetical protein